MKIKICDFSYFLTNRAWSKFARAVRNKMPTGVTEMVGDSVVTLSPSKKQKTLDTGRPVLRFAKLTENAYMPTRGSVQSAGLDLYSAYEHTIAPKAKQLCKTDIQIACPDGCYARVAPRSGLTHKHFIDVGAGVIDQDYRGNVGVILFNFGDEPFEVKKGDRIAQLILERIYIPTVKELASLDETERGAGGFGSTGKN